MFILTGADWEHVAGAALPPLLLLLLVAIRSVQPHPGVGVDAVAPPNGELLVARDARDHFLPVAQLRFCWENNYVVIILNWSFTKNIFFYI